MRADTSWRLPLWVAAAALLVVGIPSFVAPAWAVEQFPWSVGPVLAQTIGAWCLGAAGIALVLSRAPLEHLDRVIALACFVWLFGSLELLVALAFIDRVQFGHLLTWPYLVGLGALVISAVLGLWHIARRRPGLRGPVGPLPRWVPVVELLFAGFVAVLALGNITSGAGGQVTYGRFFPEPMGLFSVRAFAAFFASLSLSALVLRPARNLRPAYEFNGSGLLLLLPITAAALLNLARFDLIGQPGHLLYLAAYVGVMIAATTFVVWHRRRPERFPAGEAPTGG